MPHRTPTQVGVDDGWSTVAVGSQHTCAAKADQTLWCWGRNEWGQIGDNHAWRAELVRVP